MGRGCMSKKIKAKKKIIFLIPNLGGGGAERVLINLIRNLNPGIYDLSLILFEKKGVHITNVPDHVKIIDFKKRNKYSFLKLILLLVFTIKKEKPDIVISFLRYANVITILAKLISRTKFKLIITVHIFLSETLLRLKFSGFWYLVYKILFRYPDYVIVPSRGVLTDLIENFDYDKKNIYVINHPFNIDEIKELSKERLNGIEFNNYILAAGRLTKQKGFDLLIQAYKLICDNIKENLIIIGEGEEKEYLKNLIKEYALENRVKLLGYQKNPFKYMKNANVFILSSLWESFALVIVEAMACGVPVISTDCPSGPGEIISNNLNGILVSTQDEKELSEAISRLLNNDEFRHKLADAGKKRAEDFRIDKIVPKYEDLF